MCRKHIWILAAAALLSYNMNAVAADTAELTDHGEPSEAPSGADVLYNVAFPADIHAFLDPGDLSGRGQIFSDRYAVENYGNTDIVIKIKNIDVYYISTEEIYEFSEEEITDSSSRIKRLNINMVWENEAEQTEKVLHVAEGVYDECVLSLAASEYDENGEFVTLREGSSGCFYFTGTLNANPNLIWEDGEITACFDYEVVSTEVGEEKTGTEDEEPAGPETGEEKTDDVAEDVKDSEGASNEEEQEDGEDPQETPADDGLEKDQGETGEIAGGTEAPDTEVSDKGDGTAQDKAAEPGAEAGQDEGISKDTEQKDTDIDLTK